MELALEDFLPSYPDYVPDENNVFTSYPEKDMYTIVQAKKEFNELRLDARENPPAQGELLRHQTFIKRFMSGYTPYDSLLLWHDVGTGKTLSSIAVAEGMKHFNQSFLKALVLVRSPLFYQNFKNEIVKIAPDYLPDESSRRLNELERKRRTNKLISEYYEIDTFHVFSKTIATLPDEKIKELYSNRVIIIDEVHNLRSKQAGGGDDVYSIIHKFLHIVENTKIILLSATPIKDKVSEFASIMNLILPSNQQLPDGNAFVQEYFTGHTLQHADRLATIVKGRISYLRQTASDLAVQQVGASGQFPFPVVSLSLEEPQASFYKKYAEQDKVPERLSARIEIEEDDDDEALDEMKSESSSLYRKSREALLFADAGHPLSKSAISSSLKKLLTPVGQPNKESDKLTRLRSYSAKYHYLLDLLLSKPNENIFAYCKMVSGPGLHTLSEIMKLFGFQEAKGDEQELSIRAPRFAVIHGESLTAQIENILANFNRPVNKHGEYIRIIIGSSVLGEGRSLLSIRHIVILTPHWNFTDTDQAVGRGIRFGSHRYLDAKEQTVSIHRIVCSPDRSIDEWMYKVSYEKDRLSKQIELLVRNTTVDCTLNKARNTYPSGLNRSRECLYEDCSYQCATVGTLPPITDTYNLFYTEKEFNAIRSFIQEQFLSSPRFSYHIKEWIDHPSLSTYNHIVLLRTLYSLIYHYEPFRNPLGFTSYLKESRDVFFLSHDILIQSDLSYLYDTRIAQSFPSEQVSHDLEQYQISHFVEILTLIRNSVRAGHLVLAKRTFEALSEEVQSGLLKQMLVRLYVPAKKKPNELEQFILDQMNDSFRIQDEVPYLIDTKESLDLTSGKWGKNLLLPPNEAVVKETYERLIQIKQQSVSQRIAEGEDEKEAATKALDHYGIIESDGTLKLSAISTIPDIGKKGQVCTTTRANLLKNILENLLQGEKLQSGGKEIPYPDSNTELCTLIRAKLEERKLLISSSIQEVMKENYNKNKKPTKVKK